jgi:hypothetical protein
MICLKKIKIPICEKIKKNHFFICLKSNLFSGVVGFVGERVRREQRCKLYSLLGKLLVLWSLFFVLCSNWYHLFIDEGHALTF